MMLILEVFGYQRNSKVEICSPLILIEQFFRKKLSKYLKFTVKQLNIYFINFYIIFSSAYDTVYNQAHDSNTDLKKSAEKPTYEPVEKVVVNIRFLL